MIEGNRPGLGRLVVVVVVVKTGFLNCLFALDLLEYGFLTNFKLLLVFPKT